MAEADGADYSKGWNLEDASYLYDEEERTCKQKVKVGSCGAPCGERARPFACFFFPVCAFLSELARRTTA
jgi:hypothetical protein